MGLLSGLNALLDRLDSEHHGPSYREVILKEYYYLMPISCIYNSLRGWWRVFTTVQFWTYMTILIVHALLLGISSVYLFEISFVLFNQAIHFMILLTLAASVLICALRGRKELAICHRSIYEGFFDYHEQVGTDAALRIHQEMMAERSILLKLPLAVGLVVGTIVVAAPFLDDYGTFSVSEIQLDYVDTEVPVPMYYPFLRENKFLELVLAALELAAASITGIVIAVGGLAYSLMVQNAVKQYKIMLDKVYNLETRAKELYRKESGLKPPSDDYKLYKDLVFRKCYVACLKKICHHHQRIIKYCDAMARVLNVPLFIVYSGGSLIIAFSMITTTAGKQLPGTATAGVIVCITEVIYMFLFSFLGQRVTDLCKEFRESLYTLKWYECDAEVRSDLLIMQTATKQAFVLSMFGMMPANFETFAAIMNSAYSFYNLVVAMD
uniref:Odorant receptor n=1 Tax=Yemma signatus TaxID=300820 RepID=A0A385H6Q5_9HEMI|nr:odorant receptor [Yemma signatus]